MTSVRPIHLHATLQWLALLRHFGHSMGHAGCHISMPVYNGLLYYVISVQVGIMQAATSALKKKQVEEHPQLPSRGVQRVNEPLQSPS